MTINDCINLLVEGLVPNMDLRTTPNSKEDKRKTKIGRGRREYSRNKMNLQSNPRVGHQWNVLRNYAIQIHTAKRMKPEEQMKIKGKQLEYSKHQNRSNKPE